MEKNKILFGVIIIVAVIVAGYFFRRHVVNQPSNPPLGQLPISNDNPLATENTNKYIGIISLGEKGENIYTNNVYGLQFSYPQKWRIGDNVLGYRIGTFELFNYNESQGTGKSIFLAGQSKIEIIIMSNGAKNTPSGEDAGRIATQPAVVAGQPATRSEIDSPWGDKFLSYSILLPTMPDKSVGFRIYGDPSNFYILDDIVKSIRWIK